MLTFERTLAPLLAPAGDNQPFWIHPREMYRCFEADTRIGSGDNYSLPCEVDEEWWWQGRPLLKEKAPESVPTHNASALAREVRYVALVQLPYGQR